MLRDAKRTLALASTIEPDRLGEDCVGRTADQRVDETAQRLLGLGPVNLLQHLSATNHLERRETSHTALVGELLVPVGIDVDQKKLPPIFVGQLFQRWPKLQTGTCRGAQ